jgi:ATP-binding cassette subfamily B protein
MVFHHGELREMGTHQQLLAAHGLYWRLYQLQYSDEKLHISEPPVSNQLLGAES